MLAPEGFPSTYHGVILQTGQGVGVTDVTFLGVTTVGVGGALGGGGGMLTTSTFVGLDVKPHASGGIAVILTERLPHQAPTRSVWAMQVCVALSPM